MFNQQTIYQINQQLPSQYQLNHFEFGGNKAVTLGTITVNLETYQVNVNHIPYLEAVNQQLPTELKFTIRMVEGKGEFWIGMYNTRHGLDDQGAFRPETISFIEQANRYLYKEQQLVAYTTSAAGVEVADRVRVFPSLFLIVSDNQLLLAEEAVYQNPVDISLKRFDVPLLRNITPPLPLMRQVATGDPAIAQQISGEFVHRYEQVLAAVLETTPLAGLPLRTEIAITEPLSQTLQDQVRDALTRVLPLDAQQELEEYWPAGQTVPHGSITSTSHPALYRELTQASQQNASPAITEMEVFNLVSRLLDSPSDAEGLVRDILQYGVGLLNLPKPYHRAVEQILQGNLDPARLFDLGLDALPAPIGSIISGVLSFDNGQLSFNSDALLRKGLGLLDGQMPPILRGVLSIDQAGQLNLDLEGLANRGISQITGLLPPPLRGAFNIGLKDGRLDMSFNPEAIVGYGIGELNKVLPEGLKINLLNKDGEITGIKIGPFAINLQTGEVELDPKATGIRIIQRILGMVQDLVEAPNVVTPTALPLDILQSDVIPSDVQEAEAVDQTAEDTIDSGLPFRYRQKLNLSRLEVDFDDSGED